MTGDNGEPVAGLDGRATALLLPGRRYGPGRPLLHYARRCLEEAGRRVLTVAWTGDDADATEVARRVADLEGPVREGSHLGGAPLVVVAKSLGTHAIPWAARHGVPGVWLTPVLRDVEVQAALGDLPPGTLLVGGTADDLWDGDLAASSGLPVLQVDGADHDLEVPGDVARSIAVLTRVTTAVAEFLTWPAVVGGCRGPGGRVPRAAPGG